MEWRNVKDGYPEDGRCLVWDNWFNEARVLSCNNYYKCWDTEDEDDFEFEWDAIDNSTGKLRVEFWMPLPNRPE